MFKLTKLIQLRPGADIKAFAAALRAAAQTIPHIKRAMLEPTLPGVYNGGDLIWHLRFGDVAAYHACTAQPQWRAVVDLLKSSAITIESAAYEGGPMGVRNPAFKQGVYRTLFLSVRPGTPGETIDRFETETRAMPDYIASIGNWQLSRVWEAAGTRPWTHVWEQEYADISGLHGPYMMHPYHWGHIDRWFDPQCSDWIVDTFLCHTFCAFDGGVIAG